MRHWWREWRTGRRQRRELDRWLPCALADVAGDVLHLSTTGADRRSRALTWSGAVVLDSDPTGSAAVHPNLPGRRVVAVPERLLFAPTPSTPWCVPCC